MSSNESGQAGDPVAVGHRGFVVKVPALLLFVAKVLTVELEGRATDWGTEREERRLEQEGGVIIEGRKRLWRSGGRGYPQWINCPAPMYCRGPH